MKVEQNSTLAGTGKYAVVNMREVRNHDKAAEILAKLAFLEHEGVLDFGTANTENEFFVLRVKDRFANDALSAYAEAASGYDQEYAEDVRKIADRAGTNSIYCKMPD